MAFDYLARFHLARLAHAKGVRPQGGEWIAEKALRYYKGPRAEVVRWRRIVVNARCEADAYRDGAGDLSRLAKLSQSLANADLLYRSPADFFPSHRPTKAVTEELLQLLDVFDAAQGLVPKRMCALNPEFFLAPKVGGADADFVLDDELVELKVTAEARVTTEIALQLAGYAALQRIGGIRTGGSLHSTPFKALRIYFARHGVSARWRIGDFFPAGGFEGFCKVFAEALGPPYSLEWAPPQRLFPANDMFRSMSREGFASGARLAKRSDATDAAISGGQSPPTAALVSKSGGS